MTTNTTLFAQILPIFTPQTERVATEALRYILEQSQSARFALEQMLLTAGVEIGSLTRFKTEVSGDEGERVDLVCYDGDGTKRVLIEAKFWAGLTDNQPNTYLERLPEDTHSALLFVAPAQRIETLWPELCRRAEEQHKLIVTSDTPTSGELRGVSIDSNGHKMMLTSWRAVLQQMESRASVAGDAPAVRDIEQLLGLTERLDSDAFLPIHSDELGQEFPRRMLNLVGLVNDATERIIANGWADASRSRVASRWHGYGRNFRFHETALWFGIDFELWSLHGQTPIWLQTPDGKSFEPIHVPTGVERSEVLESLVEQLGAIRQYLSEEHQENDQPNS